MRDQELRKILEQQGIIHYNWCLGSHRPTDYGNLAMINEKIDALTKFLGVEFKVEPEQFLAVKKEEK